MEMIAKAYNYTAYCAYNRKPKHRHMVHLIRLVYTAKPVYTKRIRCTIQEFIKWTLFGPESKHFLGSMINLRHSKKTQKSPKFGSFSKHFETVVYILNVSDVPFKVFLYIILNVSDVPCVDVSVYGYTHPSTDGYGVRPQKRNGYGGKTRQQERKQRKPMGKPKRDGRMGTGAATPEIWEISSTIESVIGRYT